MTCAKLPIFFYRAFALPFNDQVRHDESQKRQDTDRTEHDQERWPTVFERDFEIIHVIYYKPL